MRRVHEILGTKPLARQRRGLAVAAAPSATVTSSPSPASGYTLPPTRTPPVTPASVISQAEHGGTAAIVTCHNYGLYLRQCLASLLTQSMPFETIIVVDDASSDDTSALCATFEPRGVRYLRGEWRDFTLARLAGLNAVPRPRFVLFVDADNWLPADFHALLRGPMENPKIGVSYAAIRCIDEAGSDLRAAPWATPFDYDRLRLGNYADACSLIRTEAYEQVGGWTVEDGGLNDWMLWLEITRAGWDMACVPAAQLMYRQHGGSMTEQRCRDQGRDMRAKISAMRRSMIVTIVTLFSGRAWQLDRYASAIRALGWDRDNLRIVAVDNSRDATFHEKLRAALDSTGIAHICTRYDGVAVAGHDARDACDSVPVRMGNPYIINVHMARLYAFAAQLLPAGTDFIWSLEDDIEPPTDALDHFCLGFQDHSVGVIAGCARDRFANRLLAWKGDWADYARGEHAGHLNVPPAPGEFMRISASGFMCTIFRRQVWDALAFRPSPTWSDQYCYYDWAAARDVDRLGWKWVLAGSVRCKHWQADGTFIAVSRAEPCGCAGKCGGCG